MVLAFCGVGSAWSETDTTDVQTVEQYGVQVPTKLTTELASDPQTTVPIKTGNEISSIPKRFQYALRLNVRGVYDDNIFLIEGQRVGDFYLAVEPGITLGYGDIVGRDRNYVQFDYAPSIFVYADHSEANAIQHLMRLTAEYRLGHLSMSLGQDVQILDGSNPVSTANLGNPNPGPAVSLDTGGGTRANIYTTNANYSYDLTGKTFLSGALHYSLYDYPDLISSQTVSANLFINFVYSPKLTVGVGGTAGYNRVESTNPDQTFEQINGSVTYEATGKINLHGTFGLEIRQFGGSSSGSYLSPVYELGASYQPFDGTSVTLSGSRHTQNSAVLSGQDYSSTSINLGIRQRFVRRFYLGLATGYQNSDYFSTVTGVNASRSDNYYFFQPAIDVTLTRYWTTGLYYLHRQSDSSFGSFSFKDNQYGFRTSLNF